VQVDPVRLTLKAPGIKLLKLKYDKPLSNFAFKLNLRHYIEGLLQRLSDVNEVEPARQNMGQTRQAGGMAVNSRNENWQMCSGRMF